MKQVQDSASGYVLCKVCKSLTLYIYIYMIAVQKPMKGFTASRSTGIDLPDMRERNLSRNVNIGERFAEDPRKTR